MRPDDAYDVIDLSRPVHTHMPVYPTIPKTFLSPYKQHSRIDRPPKYSTQTNILMMSDHAGTHIDAPIHFNPDGTSIEQFPLDLMVGAAVMQDFSFKQCGELVTAREVQQKLEAARVNPRDLKYILFRTGAAELYEDADRYMHHYLEIGVDAVEWMFDHGIVVYGVDANTVDSDPDRAAHLYLRKRECYHIENLANLEKLPQDRSFTFLCTPLALRGGSASPIRAIGLVPRA